MMVQAQDSPWTMSREPVMTPAEITRFIETDFPQVKGFCEVVEIAAMTGLFRLTPSDIHLRPGGTVSGPTLFMLADCGFYLTLMAMIGPKALAVTTSAQIDFMRKPDPARAVMARARIMKLGRVLVVGDVVMVSEGSDDVLARASLTYSIPPRHAT